MEKSIAKVARYLASMQNGTEEEFERINYMLQIFSFYISSILKFVGIIFTFFMIGYLYQSIICVVITLCTKTFMGGYHERTETRCFMTSLIIIGAAIYLGMSNILSFFSLILINSLTLFAVWNQVPIIDPKDGEYAPKTIQSDRKICLISHLILIIICFSVYKIDKKTTNIGTWLLLIQALLLFVRKEK